MANIRFSANASFSAGVVSSIASAPAAQTGLPETNLLTRDRYRICRITPSADDAAVLTCTLAADQSIGASGIFGMNLTAAATGRCRLLDSGDALLWDSGTVALFPSGAGHHLSQYNRGYVWWADQNYGSTRKIEITLTDTAATFDLSRIAFGARWSPTFNPVYDGIGWKWKNTAEFYRTQGGTGRAMPRDAWRTAQYQFRFLSLADRDALAGYLMYAGQSMMLSLFPGSGGQVETDHQMLCHVAEAQDLIPTSAGIWNTSLLLEEI